MVDFGAEIFSLITELYPICRSITGKGFRDSLTMIQSHIPAEIHEVPTGTRAFDWEVPPEWNIEDAYVKNAEGKKIIDFQQSNLHVVSYSIPIHQTMPLSELKGHLFSLPEHPDWIPYRTTYYNKDWGFCIRHSDLLNLRDGDYDVQIHSSLNHGNLTYGEYYLSGESEGEILISCHCCHPSLCNDNLSGMALSTILAKYLTASQRRYSYRFLFIPGTIGSITWLSINEEKLSKIKHGLVIACVGDPGRLTYKKSRRGDAEIDKAVKYVLSQSGKDYAIEDFSPYGYDERQYCSPGINLPVGSLTRTPHGRYPEYHTSADNLDFVKPEFLADSFNIYLDIIEVLERNHKYMNTNPKCEPQLGKRGLYNSIGGRKEAGRLELAMLWVLNYSDGYFSLLEIAEKSGLDFELISQAAELLEQNQLLKDLSGESR